MARILVLGAHPDDCEVYAGGSAVLWRRRGDLVRFVSVTNGCAGHHRMSRDELVARRRREAERAAGIADVEWEILDNDDARLQPTIERREEMIRLIRRFAPDLVLTHRPCDYHPDHRATSTIVEDSAFLVTVPRVCPETPHMAKNPAIAYLQDPFRRPWPFSPDVVVDVDSVMNAKWSLIDAHASQFYEWVPYNEGHAAEVPEDPEARIRWLEGHWGPRLRDATEAVRSRLVEVYGEEEGRRVRYAEAFETCEYGTRPSEEDLARLFPAQPG